MSFTQLAPELTDAILDHLHDDPSSLMSAALTCRRLLPASRYHLFTDVEMKPQYFTTHPFPPNLAHIAQRLRLTADSEPQASFPWAFHLARHTTPPPSPTATQLRQGLQPFKSRSLELEGIKSTANNSIFAAVVQTQNLVDNVSSLSLKNCRIDAEDSLTLAVSLPRLRYLRFCSLTIDNSRSMVRAIERNSFARCWAYSRNSSDWTTISETISTDQTIELLEVEMQDTEWSEDLSTMMTALFNRIVDPTETLTLRVNVSCSDLSGGSGLSPFGKFLKSCGGKIRRLDLCLGSALANEKEPTVLPNSLELQLSWIFDFCSQIDVLRLSGSLCSNRVIKQMIGGLKPCTRVVGIGEIGEQLDLDEIVNPLLEIGSHMDKMIISERAPFTDDSRGNDSSRRKLLELKRSGIAVIFANHHVVRDLVR